MTERPTPREVDRTLSADKSVIQALADIAEQRIAASKRPPVPAPATTKTPSPPPARGEAMKRITATRRKSTTKPTPPKPRARIELAQGAEHVSEVWRAKPFQQPAPRVASAHEVEGVTPCFTCGGGCEPDDDRYGPWRRHLECGSISQPWQRVQAAAEWFALPCTTGEAQVAALAVDNYGDQHPATTYNPDDADRSPWNHISRKPLIAALIVARQLLADAALPAPCDLGWCALCGVEESLTWLDEGHHRSDGSPAPLCSSCAPVFEKYPASAAFFEDQRGIIAEAITGVPPMLGESIYPAGLRAHAEVGGGDGQPWSHLPVEAVAAYRWTRWGSLGGRYAPEQHRAEAVARVEALEADRATRQVEPDVYGFSEESD